MSEKNTRKITLVGGPYDGHRVHLASETSVLRLPVANRSLRKKDALYIAGDNPKEMNYKDD